MESLHVIENLILLCPGCHGSFDERVPIWAFLPVDLQAFITREEAFQNRRRSFAAAGHQLRRPDPCEGTTPNLPYRRYQIRLGHLLPGVFAQPVKFWHGNPIAAILRSQSIVSGITRLDPDTQCGLPDDVALQLQKLLFLYGSPAPKLVQPEQVPSIRGTKPGSGHDDRAASDSGFSSTGQPPQSHPRPKQCSAREGPSSHSGQQQQHQHNIVMAPPASSKRRCRTGNRSVRTGEREWIEPKWVFGPRMTANRIMQWHLDTRSNMEQES